MKKLLYIFIFILLLAFGVKDKSSHSISKYFIALSGLELSQIQEFQPINEIAGRADIVGLGEVSGFDKPAIRLKTNIVKHLYTNHDFRLLIFEAGFFDTYQAWRSMQGGDSTLSAVRKALYYNIINEETKSLFAFIDSLKHTPEPLIIAGYESKFSGSNPTYQATKFLKSTIQSYRLDIPIGDSTWTEFTKAFNRVVQRSSFEFAQNEFDTLEVGMMMRKIQKSLVKQGGRGEVFMYVNACLKNILKELEMGFAMPYDALDVSYDLQNIQLLRSEIYNSPKTIIWGDNESVLYTPKAIKSKYFQKTKTTLGDTLKSLYGEKYYALGFMHALGKYKKGMFKRVIPKPSKKSLEAIFLKETRQDAFINLKAMREDSILLTSYPARILNFKLKEVKLPYLFDGLFFLNPTEPVVTLD